MFPHTDGILDMFPHTDDIHSGVSGHVENIGVMENFFDLGGTSLLVTNVVIAADRKGYSIAFKDVFDNPTPKQLAALVGESGTVREEPSDPALSDYDYSKIDGVLQKNTLAAFSGGKVRRLGNILLTGAAGYLGIHILRELIGQEDGDRVIYCMLRSKKDTSAEARLSAMYFYYFDTVISELYGSRVVVVDGDVTDRVVLSGLEDKGIDTVINCAAVVKHFSAGTLIEDVNVGGAVNLIDFCLKTGSAFIQTSTMSVVNSAYKEDIPDGFAPDERNLYCSQILDNKYIHSKFLAERSVLEAVAEQGLRGKIMRLGNLAPRHSDGEFQINFRTNSAMGRLKAFAMLRCAAYDQLSGTMEFSPIDYVAKAIVLLSGTPDDCTVFHVFNDQRISFGNIFREMRELGYEIAFVEREDFAKAFARVQSDPKRAQTLTSIMAYMQSANGQEVVNLTRKCDYTLQVLYRLGFQWPFTTWDYISRFIGALNGLGFFDDVSFEEA